MLAASFAHLGVGAGTGPMGAVSASASVVLLEVGAGAGPMGAAIAPTSEMTTRYRRDDVDYDKLLAWRTRIAVPMSFSTKVKSVPSCGWLILKYGAAISKPEKT